MTDRVTPGATACVTCGDQGWVVFETDGKWRCRDVWACLGRRAHLLAPVSVPSQEETR